MFSAIGMGDVDRGLEKLIGEWRLYEAGVRLDWIGGIERIAGVSCRLYDVEMSGTGRYD